MEIAVAVVAVVLAVVVAAAPAAAAAFDVSPCPPQIAHTPVPIFISSIYKAAPIHR